MPREALLGRTLVELADTLVDDYDVVEILTLLADRCVDVLDVDAAGIMLATPGAELQVMASSSDAMRFLELFELQSDEGPCLDSYRTGLPVVNRDLAADDSPWPRFSAEAVGAGFRSVHALPMRLRGSTLGALNLFRVSTEMMEPPDVAAAQALADIATIAVLQHSAAVEAQHLNEQLQNALNSRVIIEQAKGMLAERSMIDLDRAFEVLRTHARRNNLRLADVAAQVVDGSLSTHVLQ